jgi:hypothetical protein
VVCFDKNFGSSVETKTEEYTKYVFGKKKKSSVSTQTIESVNSTVSDSSSFSIVGGNKAKREQLLRSIRTMESADPLEEQAFKAWLSSIYYSPTDGSNLGIIEFGIMPIWNLFNDSRVSTYIQEQVLVMNKQSNNSFSAEELGINTYSIDLKKLDLSFSANGSLVKVVYADGSPFLEICNEYVPKIRTDRRVTIIYPIVDGVTRMNQGVFLGDGEGNPPAQVTFGDEDVFVTNMEDFGPNDVLTKLYMRDGNLYASSYGAAALELDKTFRTAFQYYQLASGTYKYPIVKIANLYWTREDLHEEMDFGGYDKMGKWAKMERLISGTLFANAYQASSSLFISLHKDVWGFSLNSYGYRTCWYVPLESDRQHMVEYLGRNLKSLFIGQASGFDAKFSGFYGTFELFDGDINDDFDGTSPTGVGQYSCLPFKNGITTAQNTGEVMVLTPDYKWVKADSIAANNNYYPVRAVRTAWRPYK